MDIFIKSFNRPYLLDKCLRTVTENISGYDRIIILDDGTPERFLARLLKSYPDIIIRKSEYYEQKSAMIESGNIVKSELKFPGDFWYREISQTDKPFFLLLEDDMYITNKVDLEEVREFMEMHGLLIYKMLWLGSPLLLQGDIRSFGNHEILTPLKSVNLKNLRLLTESPGKYFYYILIKLGFIKNFIVEKLSKFYAVYTVAGAVFSTNYFKELWRGIHTLDENEQILRTLTYYRDNQIPLQAGKSAEELVKTTFSSSATNEFEEVDFSIFGFNSNLNELWYSGKMDMNTESFVFKDFIEKHFSQEDFRNWQEWKTKFTGGYKLLNCELD